RPERQLFSSFSASLLMLITAFPLQRDSGTRAARNFRFFSSLAFLLRSYRRFQFVLWKAMVLVLAVSAFFCYKPQLASVGDALLETLQELAEKRRSNRKEPADYEKLTTDEFFAFAKIGRSLSATILPLDLAGIEVESDLISRAS